LKIGAKKKLVGGVTYHLSKLHLSCLEALTLILGEQACEAFRVL